MQNVNAKNTKATAKKATAKKATATKAQAQQSKTRSIRAFAVELFNSKLKERAALGGTMSDKEWRAMVRDTIIAKFDISIASASSHYNYAKRNAVLTGKCDDFATSAKRKTLESLLAASAEQKQPVKA